MIVRCVICTYAPLKSKAKNKRIMTYFIAKKEMLDDTPYHPKTLRNFYYVRKYPKQHHPTDTAQRQ
ncbi:hypothetical protein [Moraxella lacunata]|uniref:hypothetical protein n=1 Tax=Moraxella lacunata TaxID=477 RepID=UPI003EE4050E